MSDIRKGFVTQVDTAAEKGIEKAGEMNFDFVEVMMDGNNERTNLEERREDVERVLGEHEVSLFVHLPFKIDIGSPQEHVRAGSVKEIRECVELVSSLGGEKGVLHADSSAWGAVWDTGDIQPLILESIEEIHPFAAGRDFEIVVENIPGGHFDTYDLDMVLQKTGADLCLDTGHARVDGMDSRDMHDFVSKHAGRISHFHLNDTRMPEDEHLPFGSGNLDFEKILSPLKDGWEGSLSLEVFTPDWDYIEKSGERLDKLI